MFLKFSFWSLIFSIMFYFGCCCYLKVTKVDVIGSGIKEVILGIFLQIWKALWSNSNVNSIGGFYRYRNILWRNCVFICKDYKDV